MLEEAEVGGLGQNDDVQGEGTVMAGTDRNDRETRKPEPAPGAQDLARDVEVAAAERVRRAREQSVSDRDRDRGLER